jgi:polyhydroxyalkanoate synthesis regulator protein
MAHNRPDVPIKTYGSRRLYNTEILTYVSHLAKSLG